MRTWKTKTEAKTPTYNNPAKIRKICFTDRLNTEYYVQDEDIADYDLGENPTYKDYIARALDPNVDENSNVYGIAKSLKPLGVRIAEMKETINSANGALYDFNKAREEFLAKKAQQEQEQPAPTPEPIKEAVND